MKPTPSDYPWTKRGHRDGQFYAERNGEPIEVEDFTTDMNPRDYPTYPAPWWAFPVGIIIAAIILAGGATIIAFIYGATP